MLNRDLETQDTYRAPASLRALRFHFDETRELSAAAQDFIRCDPCIKGDDSVQSDQDNSIEPGLLSVLKSAEKKKEKNRGLPIGLPGICHILQDQDRDGKADNLESIEE